MKDKAHACGLAFDEEYMESDLKPEPLASLHPVWWRRPIPLLRRIIASGGTQDVHPTALKPESTEGGRRVSVLKRQEGAPVLLG